MMVPHSFPLKKGLGGGGSASIGVGDENGNKQIGMQPHDKVKSEPYTLLGHSSCYHASSSSLSQKGGAKHIRVLPPRIDGSKVTDPSATSLLYDSPSNFSYKKKALSQQICLKEDIGTPCQQYIQNVKLLNGSPASKDHQAAYLGATASSFPSSVSDYEKSARQSDFKAQVNLVGTRDQNSPYSSVSGATLKGCRDTHSDSDSFIPVSSEGMSPIRHNGICSQADSGTEQRLRFHNLFDSEDDGVVSAFAKKEGRGADGTLSHDPDATSSSSPFIHSSKKCTMAAPGHISTLTKSSASASHAQQGGDSLRSPWHDQLASHEKESAHVSLPADVRVLASRHPALHCSTQGILHDEEPAWKKLRSPMSSLSNFSCLPDVTLHKSLSPLPSSGSTSEKSGSNGKISFSTYQRNSAIDKVTLEEAAGADLEQRLELMSQRKLWRRQRRRDSEDDSEEADDNSSEVSEDDIDESEEDASDDDEGEVRVGRSRSASHWVTSSKREGSDRLRRQLGGARVSRSTPNSRYSHERGSDTEDGSAVDTKLSPPDWKGWRNELMERERLVLPSGVKSKFVEQKQKKLYRRSSAVLRRKRYQRHSRSQRGSRGEGTDLGEKDDEDVGERVREKNEEGSENLGSSVDSADKGTDFWNQETRTKSAKALPQQHQQHDGHKPKDSTPSIQDPKSVATANHASTISSQSVSPFLANHAAFFPAGFYPHPFYAAAAAAVAAGSADPRMISQWGKTAATSFAHGPAHMHPPSISMPSMVNSIGSTIAEKGIASGSCIKKKEMLHHTDVEAGSCPAQNSESNEVTSHSLQEVEREKFRLKAELELAKQRSNQMAEELKEMREKVEKQEKCFREDLTRMKIDHDIQERRAAEYKNKEAEFHEQYQKLLEDKDKEKENCVECKKLKEDYEEAKRKIEQGNLRMENLMMTVAGLEGHCERIKEGVETKRNLDDSATGPDKVQVAQLKSEIDFVREQLVRQRERSVLAQAKAQNAMEASEDSRIIIQTLREANSKLRAEIEQLRLLQNSYNENVLESDSSALRQSATPLTKMCKVALLSSPGIRSALVSPVNQLSESGKKFGEPPSVENESLYSAFDADFDISNRQDALKSPGGTDASFNSSCTTSTIRSSVPSGTEANDSTNDAMRGKMHTNDCSTTSSVGNSTIETFLRGISSPVDDGAEWVDTHNAMMLRQQRRRYSSLAAALSPIPKIPRVNTDEGTCGLRDHLTLVKADPDDRCIGAISAYSTPSFSDGSDDLAMSSAPPFISTSSSHSNAISSARVQRRIDNRVSRSSDEHPDCKDKTCGTRRCRSQPNSQPQPTPHSTADHPSGLHYDEIHGSQSRRSGAICLPLRHESQAVGEVPSRKKIEAPWIDGIPLPPPSYKNLPSLANKSLANGVAHGLRQSRVQQPQLKNDLSDVLHSRPNSKRHIVLTSRSHHPQVLDSRHLEAKAAANAALSAILSSPFSAPLSSLPSSLSADQNAKNRQQNNERSKAHPDVGSDTSRSPKSGDKLQLSVPLSPEGSAHNRETVNAARCGTTLSRATHSTALLYSPSSASSTPRSPRRFVDCLLSQKISEKRRPMTTDSGTSVSSQTSPSSLSDCRVGDPARSNDWTHEDKKSKYEIPTSALSRGIFDSHNASADGSSNPPPGYFRRHKDISHKYAQSVRDTTKRVENADEVRDEKNGKSDSREQPTIFSTRMDDSLMYSDEEGVKQSSEHDYEFSFGQDNDGSECRSLDHHQSEAKLKASLFMENGEHRWKKKSASRDEGNRSEYKKITRNEGYAPDEFSSISRSTVSTGCGGRSGKSSSSSLPLRFTTSSASSTRRGSLIEPIASPILSPSASPTSHDTNFNDHPASYSTASSPTHLDQSSYKSTSEAKTRWMLRKVAQVSRLPGLASIQRRLEALPSVLESQRSGEGCSSGRAYPTGNHDYQNTDKHKHRRGVQTRVQQRLDSGRREHSRQACDDSEDEEAYDEDHKYDDESVADANTRVTTSSRSRKSAGSTSTSKSTYLSSRKASSGPGRSSSPPPFTSKKTGSSPLQSPVSPGTLLHNSKGLDGKSSPVPFHVHSESPPLSQYGPPVSHPHSTFAS